MKILVAEDTKLVRDLIRRILSKLPFVTAIEQAEDVSEILASVGKQDCDLVLLDLDFPSGKGFDVLRSIKQADRSPTVIILSGHVDPLVHQACLATGAAFVLNKCADIGRLPDILMTLSCTVNERIPRHGAR